FPVKRPFGTGSLPTRFRDDELPSVFRCEVDNAGHSVRNIVAPAWRVVYAVFSASAAAALKTAKFVFHFLDVQQLDASACEYGNRSEIQLCLCFLTQLIEDAVFGKFSLGPLSSVVIADRAEYTVRFQKLTILFDNFCRVERRTGGSHCIENEVIFIIEMGYRQGKSVVPATGWIGETKIMTHVRRRWQLQSPRDDTRLQHFQREGRRNVLAE